MRQRAVVYNGQNHNRLKALAQAGVQILCPYCQAEIILALDWESAAKYGVHPGIYCSGEPRHCLQLVELICPEGSFYEWMGARTNASSLVNAAREEDNPVRVRVLLDTGSAVNETDGWRQTALEVAIAKNHRETVRFLLERGAEIHKVSDKARPLIRLAAEHGLADIVALLLDHGADLNLALWAAAGGGHTDLMLALLDRGADVNAVYYSYTVLMKAIAHSRLEAVRLLLERGADVNQRAPNGSNALIRATEQNHPAIVGLLLEYGADVTAQDAKGRTPLYFALRYNFSAVAERLRQAGAVD